MSKVTFLLPWAFRCWKRYITAPYILGKHTLRSEFWFSINYGYYEIKCYAIKSRV
jgi:hypothetical protein